jgi:ceramide glucosyltransferase
MLLEPLSICVSLSAVALLLHGLGYWATMRHTRLPQSAAGAPTLRPALPALTLLKPIKGLEEELELNLRSFFEQAYPAPLQLVFSSTEPGDPGIALARRVAADYPQVRVKFVLSDPAFGTNPKVANLAGALREAQHDLVLQSDANVRLRPDYLIEVVDEFAERDASMLGSLIAGRGEHSLGAALDNIQITTFTTPGICLANELAGIPCVIGKAMLFRKSELAALGGLPLVKDVLAEDYLLGQIYTRAGKRVVLSRMAVDNINCDVPVARFAARHARWLKMRVVLHVGGFIADLVSNATFFALLAFVVSGFRPAWLGAYALVVAYKVYMDQRLIERLRGEPLRFQHALYIPLRDLILPCLWVYALCSRTTEWRGQRFRLSRGSLLTPLSPDTVAAAATTRRLP